MGTSCLPVILPGTGGTTTADDDLRGRANVVCMYCMHALLSCGVFVVEVISHSVPRKSWFNYCSLKVFELEELIGTVSKRGGVEFQL